MMLDYNSLLLALGVSAACLAVTLMGSWIVRRAETVLLTATVGLVLVVSGIFVYSAYVNTPETWLGVANFVLFHAGFATIWGAGRQFLTGRPSVPAIAIRALAAMVFSVVPMLLGYDGLAFIADNIAIALLLFATARQYWLARAEAPAAPRHHRALYADRNLLRPLRRRADLRRKAGARQGPQQLGRRSESRRLHRRHDRDRRAVAGAASVAARRSPSPRGDHRSADRPAQPPRPVRRVRYAPDGQHHRRHRLRYRSFQIRQRPLRPCRGRQRDQGLRRRTRRPLPRRRYRRPARRRGIRAGTEGDHARPGGIGRPSASAAPSKRARSRSTTKC